MMVKAAPFALPFTLVALVVLAALAPAAADPHQPPVVDPSRVNRSNVLLIIADNLRPALGSYGDPVAFTPTLDALAAKSTLFARAYCSLAWCAPSRNSFLSGRRPDVTRAYNFLDSFREGPGLDWVSFPQYFKRHGYYTTSVGKVFHPNLPPNFDFPLSWTDEPYFPVKPECPNNTMSCPYTAGDPSFDVDSMAADVAIERMTAAAANVSSGTPFFLAVGFQGPRLSWSYPTNATANLPAPESMPIASYPRSPLPQEGERLSWFRPDEINLYTDIRNVTHAHPMSPELQHRVRHAYYATATHVDAQVARLLRSLNALGLDNNTVVVFMADHGQALGESNLWSMMSNFETSLRVPLFIHVPPVGPGASALRRAAGPSTAGSPVAFLGPDPAARRDPSLDAPDHPASLSNHSRGSGSGSGVPVYWHPVELVDLMTTVPGLAGLPPPPASWHLPGADLVPGMATGKPVKPAALGEITRCRNCRLAYFTHPQQCSWDAVADANYSVPCCETPRPWFDWLGMTIRTDEWRYTSWCAWNGTGPDWQNCTLPELYDHRNDTSLYDVDGPYEVHNVVNDTGLAAVRSRLDALLRSSFQNQPR